VQRNSRLWSGTPWLIVATLVAVLGGASVMALQKADPGAFSGTWKLDTAASVNPNGPPPPGSAQRSGGGAPRGGGGEPGGGGGEGPGGGGGGGLSGGGSGGGSLGTGERQRFYAMLKVLTQAPALLSIAATDKDVTFTPANGKPMRHLTDGKTEKVPTGNEQFGNLEIKTRWDGATLKRELKTVDGLTVVETYAVAPGGKQLTVSVELKSQVERLADAMRQPIKRIYDRAQ
jgi:hypothetical protein